MAARKMIAGHFGFAAGVKSRARGVPLWALMLASQWLDVIFVPLFGAHVETLDLIPGESAYGGVIIHADYTHSLVGALVIAVVTGALASIAWGRRGAFVIAGMVFSHWVLDLVVHRADMPILPGNLGSLPRLGFGLWRFPAVAATVELAFVLIGTLLYARAALALKEKRGLAIATSATLLAAGLLTLGLNVAGQ